jgi:bacteriocin biosynthesis cyclodehydratase domain-containing protein
VVTRPDGLVQVGASPRTAVLLPPPAGRRPAEPRPGDRTDEALAWAAYDPAGPSPAVRIRRRESAAVALAGSPATVEALVPVLAAAGVGRLACDRPVPGTTTSHRPADLLVLVAEHAADPVAADGVQADGVPHLSVVVRDTDALVGPLVLPGRSACLRCLDRWRTDADPAWPDVRTGLVGAPPRPTDAATAQVLAGLVALQVLAHLDGGRAASVGATLEVLLPDGRVRYRWWRPHPACGCVDLPVP